MTITITPYLLYADVDAALAFLARAFGFEEVLRHPGPDGRVNHAEARLGDDHVYLGDPSGAGHEYRNPATLGSPTVLVIVDGLEDVDALCERAREAGAQITEEPADQGYGERRFGATDPEGHKWFFSQKIADVEAADWGATAAG
ncbi:MAG TPA: VOC family protein [Solirubrobacteraceae bacterium]|nr:VOC family protein [Solirubrobacteraceae bacterium]